MIEAIIFDADGVILDTHSIYCKSDVEFFVPLGVNFTPDEFTQFLTGRTLKKGLAMLQEKFGFSGDIDDLLKQRLAVIKNNYSTITHIPGFLDFFHSINNNYKTAIATSSDPELFAIAETQLNIRNLFKEHIYFPHDVNHASKPEPDIYLHAAKMLGVAPENCLVIEDAPNGIKSAKAAGMQVIGITTTHNAEMLTEATTIVNNFNEINLSIFK